MDRASDSGSEGRGFKSLRVRSQHPLGGYFSKADLFLILKEMGSPPFPHIIHYRKSYATRVFKPGYYLQIPGLETRVVN